MKLKQEHIYLFIIVIIAIVAYINIFQNSFVWDDKDFIIDWNTKNSLSNLPTLLKGEVPEKHIGVFRPIRSVLYAFSYKLWGLNPIGYHLQSLFIHVICTILVYLITVQLTTKGIGFISALLFGAHPIHTESITFITTSFDIFGIAFFLLAFYFYLRANNNKLFYIASLIFSALAFFTYEITIILPLIIILYDALFTSRDALKNNSKFYVPYFIIAASYIFIRFFILHISGRGDYFAGSPFNTFIIMIKAFALYIWLVIFPINLSINHILAPGIDSFVYAGINQKAFLAKSFFDIDILLSAIFLISIIAASICSYKKHPLVTFCVSWFFIALLPVSNIVPIAIIMSEKYLYLPSVAFCILLGFFLYKLNKKYKSVSVIIILLILLFYIALSLNRNVHWKDDIALWETASKQNPNSAMINFNLGNAYLSAGFPKKAGSSYANAIEADPYFIRAYNNLANIFIQANELDYAYEVLKEAINHKPNSNTYEDLGIIFTKKEEYGQAEKYFQKSIELDPNDAGTYNNLGKLYLLNGNYTKSIYYLKKAVALNPGSEQLKKDLNYAETLTGQ